jgi:hypothetical protein
MKLNRIFAVLLLFMLAGWSANVNAQIIRTDTTNQLYFYTLNGLENGNDSLFTADTLLNQFHIKHTPLFNYAAIQNQGMIGTAMRSLELLEGNSGYFNEGFDAFDFYRFKRNDLLGISGKANSDLHYVQGYSNFLYITAKHYQQLGDYASFGINYRSVKQHDLYSNNLENLDKTRIPNVHNTSFNFRLDPPKGKYILVLQLTNNRINNAETGGIANTGRFDSLPKRGRLLNNEVPLSNANNVFKDFDLQLNQIYKFNLSDDSTETKNIRLFHELNLDNHRNNFNSINEDTSYFAHYYLNAITADSQKFLYLNNRLGASFVWNTNLVKLGIKQQSVFYTSLLGISAAYTTLFLQSEISRLTKNYAVGAKAEYGIGGYNNSDLYLSAHYKRKWSDKFLLKASVQSMRYETAFANRFLFSNHHIWQNNFEKQQDVLGTIAAVAGKKNKFSLELTSALKSNFVYYNAAALPAQLNSAFLWTKVKASQQIKWGWLGNKNTLVYQQSGSDKLPVPNLIVQSSLYLDGWVFEKAMWLQTGIDLFYYSAYRAPIYNAAIRQFVVIDNGEFGNYPQFDVFLDAQIKTFSFMFKYQQLNQLFIKNKSDILSPGYPNLPNSFSLGIRWRLMN